MTIRNDMERDELLQEFGRILKTFGRNTLLGGNTADTLSGVVQNVKALIECDHVFLSLYDKDSKILRAAAWYSPHRPRDISSEHKFMWDKYSFKQPVLINELSQYNHRLRPSAAHMKMNAVVGAPIIMNDQIAGILEAYSNKSEAFSSWIF